jgi:hypothetical protein
MCAYPLSVQEVLIMGMVTSGAIAALLIGLCMGATLKPSAPVEVHAQQAPRLVVDSANTGLLASVAAATHSAG